MVNVLRDGEPMRMGKRTGNFVTLARCWTRSASTPPAGSWSAARADSMMDFDLDLASKQSSENPVYYVQYAHARLARVLADAGVDWAAEGDVQLLAQPAELALIRRMLQLPEVIELAARNLAPHHVPYYAYELARATQTWYDAGQRRSLAAHSRRRRSLQAARLKLAAAARQVLANALDTIGVVAPDSM